MSYRVVVTEGAVADLAEIDDFISAHDSAEKADHVLDQLEEAVRGLADMPNRGHYPAELSSIGIRDYREIEWTTYRIIYRVSGKRVYVYVVAAARRDLQQLLHRRLLST